MGAAIAALMAMQAAAGTAQALEPSSKWTVEYEDNMCVLSRGYGAGKAMRVVGIKPVTFGDMIDIVMVVDSGDSTYRLGSGTLTLEPAGEVIEGRVRSWKTPGKPKRIVALEVPRAALPRIAAANRLSIKADKAAIRIVNVGAVKAMAALDACEKDLAASLEPDTTPGAQPLAVAASSATSPAQWMTPNDYPQEAVHLKLDGTTVARWVIGTDGRVKKCVVTERSDHPALDAVLCTVLEQRGRYRPAEDANGRPIETEASRRVVWRLP